MIPRLFEVQVDDPDLATRLVYRHGEPAQRVLRGALRGTRGARVADIGLGRCCVLGGDIRHGAFLFFGVGVSLSRS